MTGTASSPDAQILADVAALVLRRGLDGRTFPLAIDATRRRYGREAPEAVRKVAALIRWRMPDLSPAEVAEVLAGKADRLGAAGSSVCY